VEDYALGISTSETNCVFQLGEVGGCVRYHLVAGGVPFVAVPIGSNKKFATGNGAAKKDQVADKMAELWGMKTSQFVSDDVSDALSLASMAAYKHLGDLPGMKTYRFQAALVEPLEIIIAS
jgi:Holliday junction resolvasome RuvABC endonuclease subunit